MYPSCFIIQPVDVVRETKVRELLGQDLSTDVSRTEALAKERQRDHRRSSSNRHSSAESVSYERGDLGGGDDVSIGVQWRGVSYMSNSIH